MDHDQRFKILLRTFFIEFLQLFFPAWAARFDLTRITWIDKEVFADPPHGKHGYLDLVAQVPARQVLAGQRPGEADSSLALIHVEVEYPDTVAPFRGRMYEYYDGLRRQYQQPVLPLALYLQVGLEGLGRDTYVEYIDDEEVLRFTYWYAGLPALDAEQYLAGDNWLGVALSTLMRAARDRRASLCVEAMQRVLSAPLTDHQKYLLCDCIQAYAPFDESQRQEFEQLLLNETYREVRTMVKSWYDQVLEKGREEGIKGQRRLLQLMLEKRFGPLNASARQQVETWPAEQLEQLGLALVEANSLRDLGLEADHS
jgi:hypothetical protein